MIVNTDGQGALTMQRVTRSVGASEGSIYHYFSSKAVLLAELETEALEAISRSFVQGQANIQESLAGTKVQPRLAALARALGSVRFWIAAEVTLPNEVELSRRIFSQPYSLDDEQVARLIPTAIHFLQLGAGTLDGAVERGVLRAGNSPERALLALASIAGALITGRLGEWDAGLFDGRRMATDLTLHLFAGWGAPPKLLADAHELLESLSDEDLAPRPPPA